VNNQSYSKDNLEVTFGQVININIPQDACNFPMLIYNIKKRTIACRQLDVQLTLTE
jgi:hypothetical protein